MVSASTLVIAFAATALSSPLHGRNDPPKDPTFAGVTQNGLQGQGGTNCASNIVIFARGTTEDGNVGALSGPPFFDALAQKVGAQNLVVQGVDYPADVPGFLAGGDPQGSKTMAQLVQQATSQCPNSKVIMSGYSQGGQLVHNAASMLPADVVSKVAGAVIFGDPGKTPVLCSA